MLNQNSENTNILTGMGDMICFVGLFFFIYKFIIIYWRSPPACSGGTGFSACLFRLVFSDTQFQPAFSGIGLFRLSFQTPGFLAALHALEFLGCLFRHTAFRSKDCPKLKNQGTKLSQTMFTLNQLNQNVANSNAKPLHASWNDNLNDMLMQTKKNLLHRTGQRQIHCVSQK